MTLTAQERMEKTLLKAVPYSEENAHLHRQFAERMWPQKRRRRLGEYQRWKFRGPTSGPVPGLLLATDGEKVVGQLGLIPVEIRGGDEVLSAQWACDLMVDSEWRRQGIGTMLLEAAMSRPTVTLGSDPSPAADITMSRAGFRPLTGCQKMVLPVDVSHALQLRVPPVLRRFVPFFRALSQPLLMHRQRRLLDGNAGEAVELCSWTDIVDIVVEQQHSVKLPHVVHDKEFLSWRCGGLPGIVPPMSAIRAKRGGYALFEPTSTYFYVHDWAAANQAEARALFATVLELAKSSESRTIQAAANSPRERELLSALGFFRRRTPTKVIYYSEGLFAPNSERFHYCLYDSDGNL